MSDWHKIHDEEYEQAVAEAAGALVGTCMGNGESGPHWTDAFHRGFRHAVAAAFNHGYEARALLPPEETP